MFRDLIADGHSLPIYPEVGAPDGWGQESKGRAAYLSSRTGAAIIPVFIDGTGPIFGKCMKRPKPGRTKVVFGARCGRARTRTRGATTPARKP